MIDCGHAVADAPMVFEDNCLYNKLHLNVKNRVGFIMMDSGARFNKLTINMLKELKRAVAEMEAADDVACIVLSGYPGESFAVGADIGQMVKFDSHHAFAFAELGQSLFAAMESCPKPIIGALNGITMGGGCDLSLACDLRIASDALKFAHPGAKLGILTGFCGTQKLPRLLGRNFANEIFMTSDVYGPEDALRMGYVNGVHGADIVLERGHSCSRTDCCQSHRSNCLREKGNQCGRGLRLEKWLHPRIGPLQCSVSGNLPS